MSADRPEWLTDEVCRVTGVPPEGWALWADVTEAACWRVGGLRVVYVSDQRRLSERHDGTTDGIRAALLRVASALPLLSGAADDLLALDLPPAAVAALERIRQTVTEDWRERCDRLERERDELADELGARVAWCPECEAEMEACDEDRCCEGCGVDLIIYADRHSAELGRAEAAMLRERTEAAERERDEACAKVEDMAADLVRVTQERGAYRMQCGVLEERAEEAEHRADLAEARASAAEGEMHDLRDRVAELEALVWRAVLTVCDGVSTPEQVRDLLLEADHD